jgi:hypothetical protein
MNPSHLPQVNAALDWAIIIIVLVTIVVGIGAIVNAVRVNKEKHGERTSSRSDDVRAAG